MKEYVKAVRHDTLRSIENAERLIDALGEAEGAGTEKLRKATKRFARHLKEELAAWEGKYKKARAKPKEASGPTENGGTKSTKPRRAGGDDPSQVEKPL